MSAISTWSSTAASNNSAAPNGAPEGMPPSGVNDAIREIMAQVRTWYEDPEWIDDGRTYTRSDSDTVTVAGVDVTATYHAKRRVRVVGSNTGTIYGQVNSSSFSTNTTINFTFDSGSIDAGDSTVTVSYSLLSADSPAYPSFIRLATEQATTSGTAITFSDIPAGVKRITIMLEGVSTDGTQALLVQIGDSGGVETTGYVSSEFDQSGASHSTEGFLLNGNPAANDVCTGVVTLYLKDAANFTWVAHGVTGDTSGDQHAMRGVKSLSAELDRVVLTTAATADDFDAGSVNIQYEF